MHADQPLAARRRGSGKAAPDPDTPGDGAPPPGKPRKVRKRRRGGFARFVTFLFSAGLVLAVFGGIGAVIAWQHFARDLPDHARLTDYEPPVMSRVYAGDSRLLAELATERRVFVPIVVIPKLVQDAFDQQPETYWYTRRYNSPQFGGLKDGIGFAVTLEEKAPVGTVIIDTAVTGGNVEIRATSPSTPTEGPVLASGPLSPGVEFEFDQPVEAESIVLWFTELPQNPAGENRVEINEILIS